MNTKICSSCFEEKPLEAFYNHGESGRKRHNCIPCHIRLTNERKKKKANEYLEKDRFSALKRNYGLSVTDYNNMLLSQGGSCPICERHQKELDKPLVVDHDHNTGKVRKLLCNNCNVAIGLIEDNVRIANSLVQYLEQYS